MWDTVDKATSYNIKWSEMDGGNGGNDTVNMSDTFYTIKHLTPCTDYLVSVEAMQDTERLDFDEQSTKTKGQGKKVLIPFVRAISFA